MMRWTLLTFAPLALLLGCAPRQTSAPAPAPVTAQTPVSRVSFYPQETGLSWSYLPEGDTGGLPYSLKALGPTVFGDAQVRAFELTGRGAQQTWYRQIDTSGQKLLGFRKPGLTVTLTPAWQEWPAEGAWRVGLSWSGTTTARLRSDDGQVDQAGTVTYRYTVLDQRQVSVAGQTYQVWVVDRQITDTLGGLFPASETIWFTPYVGDVRTAEALLLTGRNFQSPGKGN
ncbi:hypothetical protein DKM44_11180 [Deinococcus irradiatisoli]|uniref:Lipoprotein n=1 Tax=Deinococcus irradiatisoli TaxID=2202254 RepID=A0A2Z3JFA8_9DEIO|nr:hypothetical protein [Deinococcus irradiatisoli]AWN23722.1 hypothetical protein DKM44_11180 [Deinococcus irradiatisoli]